MRQWSRSVAVVPGAALLIRNTCSAPTMWTHLRTRGNIALWTGKAAIPAKPSACRRCCSGTMSACSAQIIPIHLKSAIISPVVPVNAEMFTKHCGCSKRSLPDEKRVLGSDHPDVFMTRNNLATWTNRSGNLPARRCDSPGATAQQERLLGPKHPTTSYDTQQYRSLYRRMRKYSGSACGCSKFCFPTWSACLTDHEVIPIRS